MIYAPRRFSSASTARRIRSDRFSPGAQAASRRARVPAGNRAGVCSSLILGRPTADRVDDITFSAKPCILMISPIDGVNDISYLGDIRYGGKAVIATINGKVFTAKQTGNQFFYWSPRALRWLPVNQAAVSAA